MIIHKTNTDAANHLTDLLMRRIHNAYLLHAALTILPICDSGRALDNVASYPKLHARTIHLLMILDPFIPDGIGNSSNTSGSGGSSSGGGKVVGGVGVEELRRIDIARRERHKQTTNNNNNNNSTNRRHYNANNLSPKAVQIAEPSIRHKEDTQYILPNILYFNYSIADAHLRLLIALVSCNSTYGPPVVRTLWTLLTDFGPRWKEYMVSYNNKLGHEDRVVLLESERPVPGMAGLSVEFIRDVLSLCNGSSSSSSSSCGVIHKKNDNSNDMTTETSLITNTNTNDNNHDNNDNNEEIYSDRLPHGRVYRLLLAINNIFRICPQSKVDLLREMSTNFPHYKFCPRPRYLWYIHTCMQLVQLATTSYEGPVLALFMDRALDMDVEIKINDAGAVALSNTTATTDDGGDNFNNDLVTTTTTTTADSRKRSYEQMSDNTYNVSIPSSNDGGTSSTSTTTISTNAIVEGSKDVDEDLLEISERLDTLMSTIYGHIILITTYQSNSLTSAMSAVVRVRKLYRLHLEGVFERKVRTTDRTKFVQFIFLVLFGRENDALVEVGRLLAMRREEEQQQLLHQNKMEDTLAEDSELIAGGMITTTMPSSSDEPLYRGFIAKLIDYFYNPNYAGDAPRRTVVCYLASFVSRATYVCPETVCECLAALLRWAEVYIAAQLSDVMPKKLNRLSVSSSSRLSLGGGNTQHPCEMHALFYTCCQAAFYIFCFRGAEALTYYHRACQHQDDPEAGYADPQSVDIGPERWKFLCGHSLQPLKYCLESVRSEFLTLAQDLNLFYNDVGDDDHEGGGEGINRKDEATKFIEQLRTSTSSSSSSLHQEKLKQTPSSPFPKKLKLSGTPKSRRSTIISTAATQEKKRLDGGVGGLGRGSNPLDSFFPFDPYLLKHSHEYVCPYFRNWQDCILTIDEEEEEYFVDSNYDDIPVEESVVNEEDSNSEAESDDDNDDNDDERIDDVESEISDIDDEDEEIVIINEKEIGDDEFDKERDEEQRECSLPNNTLQKSLSSDNHLELEIRRSRAMSTGSQCSW